MDEILKLVKLLQNSKTSNDLLQGFRSNSSVKLGLQHLYFTLKHGIAQIDDGKLGFQNWTSSQIQALISIVKLFLSTTRSLSFEQTEPLIVAIVEKSLEFSLCVLEKSGYTSGDLSIQNNIVQLLEIALVDGFDKESFDVVYHFAIEELLPIVQFGSDGVELDKQIQCTLQEGTKCLREGISVDRVLMTLTSEFLQPDSQTTILSEPAVSPDLNNVISLAGHIAVVHLRCVARLVAQCTELLKTPKVLSDQTGCGNHHGILSFCFKDYKFLGNLTKDSPYVML